MSNEKVIFAEIKTAIINNAWKLKTDLDQIKKLHSLTEKELGTKISKVDFDSSLFELKLFYDGDILPNTRLIKSSALRFGRLIPFTKKNICGLQRHIEEETSISISLSSLKCFVLDLV